MGTFLRDGFRCCEPSRSNDWWHVGCTALYLLMQARLDQYNEAVHSLFSLKPPPLVPPTATTPASAPAAPVAATATGPTTSAATGDVATGSESSDAYQAAFDHIVALLRIRDFGAAHRSACALAARGRLPLSFCQLGSDNILVHSARDTPGVAVAEAVWVL